MHLLVFSLLLQLHLAWSVPTILSARPASNDVIGQEHIVKATTDLPNVDSAASEQTPLVTLLHNRKEDDEDSRSVRLRGRVVLANTKPDSSITWGVSAQQAQSACERIAASKQRSVVSKWLSATLKSFGIASIERPFVGQHMQGHLLSIGSSKEVVALAHLLQPIPEGAYWTGGKVTRYQVQPAHQAEAIDQISLTWSDGQVGHASVLGMTEEDKKQLTEGYSYCLALNLREAVWQARDCTDKLPYACLISPKDVTFSNKVSTAPADTTTTPATSTTTPTETTSDSTETETSTTKVIDSVDSQVTTVAPATETTEETTQLVTEGDSTTTNQVVEEETATSTSESVETTASVEGVANTVESETATAETSSEQTTQEVTTTEAVTQVATEESVTTATIPSDSTQSEEGTTSAEVLTGNVAEDDAMAEDTAATEVAVESPELLIETENQEAEAVEQPEQDIAGEKTPEGTPERGLLKGHMKERPDVTENPAELVTTEQTVTGTTAAELLKVHMKEKPVVTEHPVEVDTTEKTVTGTTAAELLKVHMKEKPVVTEHPVELVTTEKTVEGTTAAELLKIVLNERPALTEEVTTPNEESTDVSMSDATETSGVTSPIEEGEPATDVESELSVDSDEEEMGSRGNW